MEYNNNAVMMLRNRNTNTDKKCIQCEGTGTEKFWGGNPRKIIFQKCRVCGGTGKYIPGKHAIIDVED